MSWLPTSCIGLIGLWQVRRLEDAIREAFQSDTPALRTLAIAYWRATNAKDVYLPKIGGLPSGIRYYRDTPVIDEESRQLVGFYDEFQVLDDEWENRHRLPFNAKWTGAYLGFPWEGYILQGGGVYGSLISSDRIATKERLREFYSHFVTPQIQELMDCNSRICEERRAA